MDDNMLHFRVPTPEELAKADKSSMVRKQSKDCTAQQEKKMIPVTNNVFGGSSASYSNFPSFPPLPSQYPLYPDDTNNDNNDDDDIVARLFAAGYL